ncbi:ribitol-5-phosphate transferase FKTN [Neosynchiropus ocellatus]
MSRLTRTSVVTLLVVISCVFLLVQVAYYRNYVSAPAPSHLPSHVTSADVQWGVIKKFLGLGRRFGLRLFLADTAALALLSQDALRLPSRCSVLCTRPVVTFGLFASQWKYEPRLLLAAKESGFGVLELRGEDPRLVGLDVMSSQNVPLFLLLQLHGTVIQVVFLYERSGNFLWHGELRLPSHVDRALAPFKHLDYGRHAGAYDRPRMVLTVVDGLDVQVPQNISHFLFQRNHSRFLECHYADARSFLQSYPEDSGPQALDFRRQVKLVLRLAAAALDRLGVPFWISSGTCLGWFRQCGLISYSHDVDIGIFVRDYRDDIVKQFANAGLALKHKFGKVEDSLELSFVQRDVKLDVFFFYEDGDLVWNGGTQAKSGRKFKYVFPKFSLCWAQLLELKVRVPCQTLDYVMANYGPSWNVPVKTWDWKSSPSNVEDNGVWPPAEWDELIQVH